MWIKRGIKGRLYLQQAFVNRPNGKREVCCKKKRSADGKHFSLFSYYRTKIYYCLYSFFL